MADIDIRRLQREAAQGDQRALALVQRYAERHQISLEWHDQKVFPLFDILQIRDYLTKGWNGRFTLLDLSTKTRASFRLKRAKRKKKQPPSQQERRPSWITYWDGARWVWAGAIYPLPKPRYDPMRSVGMPPETKDFLQALLFHVHELVPFRPSIEFWHHGICGRCGSNLIVEAYKKNKRTIAGVCMGLGPVCARKPSSAASKRAH